MTIYQWVSNEFAPAFSRMLLHSLWIGVIASLLAVVIIVSTKKTPASMRYNWLVLLFVVTLAATATVFFNELGTTRSSNNPMVSTLPSANANNNVVVHAVAPKALAFTKKNMLSEVVLFLDSNSLLIVSFWFLIFFFHLFKMGLGLRFVHILKRHRVHQAEKQWITWLQQKSAELGIKKVILFLESELIKIPTAIGHLKPVILIPFGLLSQLSPQEVESILVHELAHIKRRDYLVNLLQSFIEAIFFFNPAFLWLSSLIRQEREKCCDDIAVQHSSRKDYLNALLSFQNIQHRGNYTMALGGHKPDLLDRVKRIVSNENNRPGRAEVCLLLIAIMITGLSFMAFTSKEITREKLLQNEGVSMKNYALSSSSQVEEKKYSLSKTNIVNESKNKMSSIQMIPEVTLKSKTTITSTITFNQIGEEKVELENNEKLDTGSLPLMEYRDITLKPIGEKGSGYQLIEATDVNGKHYQIEAIRNNIQKLIINGQEVSRENYEYYRDVVRHIEFNSQWVNQRKFPAEWKEKVLRAGQISFEGNDKIRTVTRDFMDTASNPSNTTLVLERVREIQQEVRRKVSEILEGKN